MAKLFGGTIRSALVHAVTRYDARREGKPGYNHYALAQYLARVDEICADIANGAASRDAICAGMTGPLLAACLKAAAEPAPSRDELSGLGKVTYQPAARG